MKKYILMVIGLFMVLSVGCTPKEDVSANRKNIVIGLDDHFPPLVFRNDEGESNLLESRSLKHFNPWA